MAVSLSTSDVRIFSNVRFTKDYQHVRWFETTTERDAFFANQAVLFSTTNAKMVLNDNNTGIFKCPRNKETINSASYMVFKNLTKNFYAFIDRIDYENDGNTIIYFTIDIIQTYRFDLTFQQSLVEREHCYRYANGKPINYTLPEGINYGEAYDVVDVKRIQPYDSIQFLVTVCKQPFHINRTESGIQPTRIGVSQPLSYYIQPFYSITGDPPPTTIGGTLVELSPMKEVQWAMWNSPDAVENVVTQYVTDFTGLQTTYLNGTLGYTFNQILAAEFAGENANYRTMYVKVASTFQTKAIPLGNKYLGLPLPQESKLLMYPYTVYELSDLKGSTMEIRPEWITSETDTLWIRLMGGLGTSPKVALSVEDYNTTIPYGNNSDMYRQSLISSTQSSIPVVSEYLAAFLQGNQNQMDARKTSAVTNGVFGTLGSIIGAVATKNPAALMGAASSIKDTALEFNNMNAQIKDISNMPPNLAGQGDNPNFDYGNSVQGYFIFVKQIKPEYRKMISDYFKMFGYKVSQLKVPNIKTRTHFNYIKCVEAMITSVNTPPTALQEIKRLFESGITLWHTNDMLNYNVSNADL